jgi:AcrR family transcriptional regulator
VPYHHGNLPAALLDAIESAIAEHGVSGVSLRDVSRRAGVSHSAPAHHFGSKSGMLTAFATVGYRMLIESARQEAAALDGSDLAAQIAALGQGYVRFAVHHPAHFELMFRADLLDPDDKDLIAARSELNGLLVDAIERCRAAGYLRDQPAVIVQACVWSLAHGLAALWISGRLSERTGEDDPQLLAKAVTELLVRAVLPPP